MHTSPLLDADVIAAAPEPATDRGVPRLRICILVPYDLADAAGGVKHHAVQLARMLRRDGHSVVILGASSVKLEDPHMSGIGGIVNIPSNGSDNKLALFASPLRLRKFFRENKFDVIHVHEPPVPSLAYWTAWLTPGVPKMGTFHAFQESPPLGLRMLAQLTRFIQYPFLDHAIAVSQPAARWASHAWKRPLPIVPNGIPIDVFTPGLRPAQQRSERRILAIGKLSDDRKGIATILDAYARLRANDVRWTLDVVGEDPSSPRLPRMDGLTYHPPLPLRELVERFRDCDVFTAPSTGQESFGIVLLEAMATGKPIVCSDIEGYRQVAHPSGAVLVPPRDVTALAVALESLMADEPRRRAMSAFNLAYVRQYDWQAVARAVVDQYLVTIENHRARRGLAPLGLLDGWIDRSDTIPALPPARASDSGEQVMPGVVADVEAEQAIGT
jgi:phosphatidylinositol alpha-mannosyltransferase